MSIITILIVLLAGGAVIIYHVNNPTQYITVDGLWDAYYAGENLEGKVVIIRGKAVYDIDSQFRFNSFFLVDNNALPEQLTPEYGFWFGVSIPEVECEYVQNQTIMICQPFDPRQATSFELRGTLHVMQVGKKTVFGLTEVDFENSRLLIDGKWHPIMLGEFEIPID